MICPFCGKEVKETWQMLVERIGRFHEEKQKEFGVAKAGRRPNGWSLQRSSKEKGVSLIHMKRIWNLYRGMKEYQSLQTKKTLNEALEYLKRLHH